MGVIELAYGILNFGKKVAKAGGVAAVTGFAYMVGSGGTFINDTIYYATRGILTIDPATFHQHFFNNVLAALRHSNEVGGAFATSAAVGSALMMYKVSRR